jgi:hypothetical protein
MLEGFEARVFESQEPTGGTAARASAPGRRRRRRLVPAGGRQLSERDESNGA